MDKNFEEVKKILREWNVGNMPIEDIAHQICQRFPKTVDNPDGYKQIKPDKDVFKDVEELLGYPKEAPYMFTVVIYSESWQALKARHQGKE